ncbi:MAG: hypothetical protein V4721_02795 [Bacteroidota bacterium]
MKHFIAELKRRNPALYWYGVLNFFLAAVCVVIIALSDSYILGIPAFLKPMKFFISIGVFVWTMGWLVHYLNRPRAERWYTWMVILVFIIESVIIVWQAANGRLSHFNISKPLYLHLFNIMGIAITVLTIWTGYIGFLFFRIKNLQLPNPYLWGIRLGIIFFVVFAFEGFAMAAFLRHTVGAQDGGEGMPITNWSIKYGDLRIAHFFGMHTLQLLPLFGNYIARKTSWMLIFALIYLIFVVALLVQALNGSPLF